MTLITSDNKMCHLQLAWYDGKCFSLCGKVIDPVLQEVPDDAYLCPDCARVRDGLVPRDQASCCND
jgi:hypothetical protein